MILASVGNNVAKRFLRGAALVSCLTMVACSDKPTNKTELNLDTKESNAIIGGEVVGDLNGIGKYVVAMVGMSAEGQISCTGVILSESVVVTAAHCVSGIRNIALVFKTNLKKAEQSDVREVVNVFEHPKFQKAQAELVRNVMNSQLLTASDDVEVRDQGDIALVKFSGGLPQGYEPAKFLSDEDAIQPGAKVVLSGYGATSESNMRPSDNLKSIVVPIEETYTFSETEVVVNQQDGGACHGDSGGPAFVEVNGKMKVLGIATRIDARKAKNPNDCKTALIYTKFTSYRGWVGYVKTIL